MNLFLGGLMSFASNRIKNSAQPQALADNDANKDQAFSNHPSFDKELPDILKSK